MGEGTKALLPLACITLVLVHFTFSISDFIMSVSLPFFHSWIPWMWCPLKPNWTWVMFQTESNLFWTVTMKWRGYNWLRKHNILTTSVVRFPQHVPIDKIHWWRNCSIILSFSSLNNFWCMYWLLLYFVYWAQKHIDNFRTLREQEVSAGIGQSKSRTLQELLPLD